MRELKFRGWDSEFSHMIYSDAFILADFFCDDYEYIMQFTGLHDKNKKEVFEGDILKLQYPLNYGYAGIYNQEIIVTISFENGSFWFTGEGYTDCNWHFYNEYEIIGNIYEHKHLIE